MRVDLRRGEQTLGTLIIEDDRKPLLQHELSFEQLRVRPRVLPADENGNSLKVIEGRLDENAGAVLLDGSGSKMLTVRKDTFGFLDVEDPKETGGNPCCVGWRWFHGRQADSGRRTYPRTWTVRQGPNFRQSRA